MKKIKINIKSKDKSKALEILKLASDLKVRVEISGLRSEDFLLTWLSDLSGVSRAKIKSGKLKTSELRLVVGVADKLVKSNFWIRNEKQ